MNFCAPRDGGQPQSWLFPGPNRVNPLTPRQLNRTCHAARLDGIDQPISRHSLRRSFADRPLRRMGLRSPFSS